MWMRKEVKSTKQSEYIEAFLKFLKDSSEQFSIAQSVEKDMDMQTQDILHHIELQENTPFEYITEGLFLRNIRRKRRRAKDTQRILKPVIAWVSDNARIIRSLEKLLGEVRKAERYTENQSYSPKTDVMEKIFG